MFLADWCDNPVHQLPLQNQDKQQACPEGIIIYVGRGGAWLIRHLWKSDLQTCLLKSCLNTWSIQLHPSHGQIDTMTNLPNQEKSNHTVWVVDHVVVIIIIMMIMLFFCYVNNKNNYGQIWIPCHHSYWHFLLINGFYYLLVSLKSVVLDIYIYMCVYIDR